MSREVKVFALLKAASILVVKAFNLKFTGLVINELLVVDKLYGRCWIKEKLIELRLKKDDGSWFSDWFIMDTLAHELAHLAEGGHGQSHKFLYFSIREALKRSLLKRDRSFRI